MAGAYNPAWYPEPQPRQQLPKLLPSNGGSPPFRQIAPVIVRDPQRPIYGIDWQYGFTWSSQQQGAGNQSNAGFPPGTVLGASGAAAPDFAAYGLFVDTWSAQNYAPVAAIQPLPVSNNPPPFTFAIEYAVRGIWPEPQWEVVYGGPQGEAALSALTAIMPNVIGLDAQVAIGIIAAIGGVGFVIGTQDTIYPTQPITKNIVLQQFPLPGAVVSGAFRAPLIVSSGFMRLPDIGDDIRAFPNIVIGSTTFP